MTNFFESGENLKLSPTNYLVQRKKCQIKVVFLRPIYSGVYLDKSDENLLVRNIKTPQSQTIIFVFFKP